MLRLIKVVVLSLSFLLFICGLCAATAYADDQVGWKVVFGLSCSPGTVEFGANDTGSGYARGFVDGPVRMDREAGYTSIIHLGADTIFQENLIIEPQANAPDSFILSWTTFNWDKDWLYRPGNIDRSIYGRLPIPGEAERWLDLSKSGSTTLGSSNQWYHYANGDPLLQMPIFANQAVPEPSSIFALGGGFGAMLLRRYRFRAWSRK